MRRHRHTLQQYAMQAGSHRLPRMRRLTAGGADKVGERGAVGPEAVEEILSRSLAA